MLFPGVSSVAADSGESDEFSATVKSIMPLSAEEVRRLRALVEEKQRAIYDVNTPASTTLKTVAVSLQAGAVTPVITLLPGHAVGLEINDNQAQPWPVLSYTVGDPQRYQVSVPEVAAKNVLAITPRTHFGRSNLVLQLQGESTPVSFILQADPGVDHFHDRISVLVAGQGPNATPLSAAPPLATENTVLLGVLDGIAPTSSISLVPQKTSLIDAAWRQEDTLWLRGQFVLLSPAFQARIAGAGGIIAYQLPWSPTIVALDGSGKSVSIQLEERPYLR